MQCVDCVAEANKAMRQPRTALGAPVTSGRPVITLTMIGLCVLSFILQKSLGWDGWTLRWVFSPAIGELEPHRFLTAAFLHSENITHILFNMYALWITGQILEPLLGRLRFTALYLLSAIGGSVAVQLLATPGADSWYGGVLGASGAVFGLFGALLVVLKRFDQNATQIVVLIAINLVIGFVIPQISWQGHIGGLITGAAMGLAFAYAPRKQRRLWGILVPLLTAAVLVGLALIKYASV